MIINYFYFIKLLYMKKFLKIFTWFTIFNSVIWIVYFSIISLDTLHFLRFFPLKYLYFIIDYFMFPLGLFFLLPFSYIQIPLLILNLFILIFLLVKKQKKEFLILSFIAIILNFFVLTSNIDGKTNFININYIIVPAFILLIISIIIWKKTYKKLTSRDYLWQNKK